MFMMLLRKDLVVSFVLLWIFINNSKCQDMEEISKTLDEILVGVRSFRKPRDHEDTSLIWQEYEFGTGAGNREEIVVTNISTYRHTEIPSNIDWRFLETNNLIYVENTTLFFERINLDDLSIEHVINITINGHILLFKVLDLNINNENTNDLMVVLFVKFQHSYLLHWYRIFGDTYMVFPIMPLQKQIEDMQLIRDGNQYKLLLLNNDDEYLEEQSLIDVYGFDIDYNNQRIDIWLCRRLYVPRTFNMQVYSIYESTMLALQGVDYVVLYESGNDGVSCQYEEIQVIKTGKLKNFICFESGYIEYLAIAAEKSYLFHFYEKEFHNNNETDLYFNETVEITWITAIPLNTYREESLLLIQLKNSTVIALAWQGTKFTKVPLPNEIMNDIDLSKIVVIPKFGFLYKNVFVRIETMLRDLPHPMHAKTESMLKTQALLEEVFRKQETVFDETEMRVNQSYYENSSITGLWNFSNVNALNVTIGKNVNYKSVKVGPIDLTVDDIGTKVTSSLKKVEELERILDEILLNLTNMIDANSTRIYLPHDVEVTGDLLVNGTMHTKNLTAAFINNSPTEMSVDDHENSDIVINGQKSFPTVDIDNLTVLSLNGIPLDEIVFDTSVKDYSNVDFANLKRLEIDGHLNFSEINDVNWENLMQNIVWKDTAMIIPGDTIIEGELIVEEGDIENLNNLHYPNDYVLMQDGSTVDITGEKSFVNLSTKHLLGLNTINGIDIDDFIILNRHEIIDEEIVFENLEIIEDFKIDGEISGLNISNIEQFLNETDKIQSDVIFENLTVLGNIVLEDSIDTKTWTDFDDLLLKTEKNVMITGKKRFLNGVNIKSKLKIESGLINDHLISEFVTLDTDQEFPFLKKISANVTFTNVTIGALKDLEDYIVREQSSTGCLDKTILFVEPPVIDHLTFDSLQQTIPQTVFLDKLNETLRRVYFENLTLSTLTADEILPTVINGIYYDYLSENILTASTRQNLTGTLTINNLETDSLKAQLVNGLSLTEWNQLLIHSRSLYDDIFNGNRSLQSLSVTGTIKASAINGNDILDIYPEDRIATVIFNGNVSIDDLTVTGFVNGLNISKFMADAVRKDDRNVTFTGHKTFINVTCESLNAQFINDHSVEDILDDTKEQTLKGPVVVKGSVTVLRNFSSTGKIGDMYLRNFTDRFQSLGNNSYALRGDCVLVGNVTIDKLDVTGSIQMLMFQDFLETVIFKNDTNITISGMKLFTDFITFNNAFIIDGTLNDLDLREFYEKAVYIDKPFSINSEVIFTQDVDIKKDISVRTKLESDTIMGVNIKDLQQSVIPLNKPKYFRARMILDNAIFKAGIAVTQVNDLQMDLLIPLHTEQTIMADRVNCNNITYRNIQILGQVNHYNLNDVYTDTFMVYGDQHITGNINIRGNVYAQHDFNTHLLNGFNPRQIISLVNNNTLRGNFMFRNPVFLNESLRIFGLLNERRPINWQEHAVKKIDAEKQIISGKWRVHGNVYFENNVEGSEFLNNLNMSEVLSAVAKEHDGIDNAMKRANENLDNICTDLNKLKCNAVNQIYKFDTFDYLEILEFDGDIHDMRYVEFDNLDYLFVNYDNCRMTLLLYTQNNFEIIDEVSDFGLIDHWIFLESKHSMYFLTIAKRVCGTNSVNSIWKLENNSLTHILELKNTTDATDLYQEIFAMMLNDHLETDPENVQLNLLAALISYENKKSGLAADGNRSILMDDGYRFAYKHEGDSSNTTYLRNCLGCRNTLNFKAGIYTREEYIYYDKELSQDYIYLCKNDVMQTKILQAIKAHRPKSFIVLNFEGLVETLLIFVENDENIQVYEYRGIDGFVYRNTVNMKVDKLYNLKVRKHNNLHKRHCLAAVHENRLTILEAKMHGEKLDLETLAVDSCDMKASC